MITVFGYDHEHKKTSEGLIQLKLLNIDIDMVYLAPWRELDVKSPPVRFGPIGNTYWHPRHICDMLGIPYRICKHRDIPGKHVTGIILGARILPQKVIDKFTRGIINLHPARLPDYKGLSCMLDQWKDGQGSTVTAHYISKKVDEGPIIGWQDVEIFETDSMFDIWERNMNCQIHKVLKEVLDAVG